MTDKKEAFVALVTCFNDDETINYEATRAQVRRQVSAGNSIMCAGTNGDFSALTFEEKVRLCGEVVDEVAGRARVIVNAGMPATFETVKLAREFDRIGVDGIAVITPFFIACTQDGLERTFHLGRRYGGNADLSLRHSGPPPRTISSPRPARRLAAHGNIAGIKDSGGAQDTLEAFMEVGRDVDGFDVYSGPDQLVHWALTNGAKGCISGLGNVMPDVLARIVSCVNAGDEAGAAKAQETYAAFRTDLYKLGYPPALVKRALYLRDPSVGLSRQPALLPDPEQDRAIEAILSRYGL